MSQDRHIASYDILKGGVYGEGMLGSSFTVATWQGVNSLSAINDTANIQSVFQSWTPQGTKNQSNFSGRIALSYEILRDKLSLAAEVDGTFSRKAQFKQNINRTFSKNTQDDGSASTQVLTNTVITNTIASLSESELDIDINPGFYMAGQRVLLYARAGLAFNKLSISDSGTWIMQITPTTPTNPTTTTNAYSTSSINTIGERLGLGLEYRFTKHVRGTIDYTYANFGRVTTIATGNKTTM